ncbi:MAG: tRNA nuclease WapA [Chlamydiae bacterium]|nr:tRNA nuclease WapA [Chlamydiota bacterium]
MLTPSKDLAFEQVFTAFGEGQSKFSWGFSSKRHDPETGLIYFGRRFYDPTLGRFITSDPEGYTDSANLYAYCQNNPLTNKDPYGLFMDDFLEESIRQKDYFWHDFAPSLREFGTSFTHGITNSLVNNAEFVGGFGAAGADILRCDKGFANINNLISTTESVQALTNQTFAYDRNGIGNTVAYGIGMFGTEAAIAYMTKGSSLLKHLPLIGKASRAIPEARSFLKTTNVSRKIFQSNKARGFLTPSVELNKFHSVARNLSEVGQNNIRILRGWAKSKAWEKLPNSMGGPETWGKFNASTNKFEWYLKIKPEPSFRQGLQVGSNAPRASVRLKAGKYINPFTGEIGNRSIGGHIPLDAVYYK